MVNSARTRRRLAAAAAASALLGASIVIALTAGASPSAAGPSGSGVLADGFSTHDDDEDNDSSERGDNEAPDDSAGEGADSDEVPGSRTGQGDAGRNPAEPASPATGAEVDESYFGPLAAESFSPGSQYQVGPQQLLRSGTIDDAAQTVTIPLYEGQNRDGKTVWYILTDTTDRDNADALGLNFSGKLAYATQGAAVREAVLTKDAGLMFESGEVDFSPKRSVTPGKAPNFFPPARFQAGSIADENYSPYVQITNSPGTPVYNAPVVAFDASADEITACKGKADHSRVHDRVVAICPSADSNGTGTVTLRTTPIFSFAKPATYISMEASDEMVAVLDQGTFAPALGDLQTGRDDSAFSAVERLFVTANGPTGAGNPQRQGLNSALSDVDAKGKPLAPLQVIGGIPNVGNDYSPAWDLNLGFWTDEAIDNGYRSRLIDEFQLLGFVEGGWITGMDGEPYGSTGIVVNCPIVQRFL